MSAIVLTWSLVIAQVSLALAMACAAFRMLSGPRAQDRVLGLDTFYVNGMLLLLTVGIHSGSTLYFEVALVIALLGFILTAGRLVSKLGELTLSAAVVSQVAMALVCLLFVILGVKSFAAARRNRQSA